MKQLIQWLQKHPWDAFFMLALGLIGLGIGYWCRNIILDDAMITFRVAENLAHGKGLVYNPGERVQVTTTPLYAVILAIGTWIAGSAVRVALVLNLCLAALIPVLAYNLGRILSNRLTGLSAALLISLMPLLIIAFSMESYLYVALILSVFTAYATHHLRLAGLLIGITALTRGDAALVGAVVLTYDFIIHRRLYWAMIIPAIGLPALWYLGATIYYGSPFPATLSAKTAQGELNWLGYYFLSGLWEYYNDWVEDYSWINSLFPLLMLLGLVQAIRTNHRAWLPLLLHGVLYTVAFYALGVTFAEWYYAPLTPAIALLTGRGVAAIACGATQLLARLTPVRPALQTISQAGLTALLTALLLAGMLTVTGEVVADSPNWKARAYPDAARWIAANTSASATLATIDIGHLGYWSGRHIIDIVGLAQPDVPAQIAKGDFGYAIRHYQPDLVLLGALWLPEVQTEPWFQADYAPRHLFQHTGMDEPLVLFSRREGVKVQSQQPPAADLQPLAVDFNRQITLTGYHLSRPALPSSPLYLTLVWQPQAPIQNDFTVFVQLLDGQDNIIAQGDSKPQHGFYPTPYWQPGETIIDGYTLPLPADIASGSYTIAVGFYEAENGNRLQILDAAGKFQGDAARLPGVKVNSS